MIAVARVLVGVGLLLLGRKLFWLFVGGIGFLSALGLATRYLGEAPEWLLIGIGLAAGVAGALLAVFLQKAGVFLAGFVGGGIVLIGVLERFGVSLEGLGTALAFVAGGVAGAMVVAAAFEWALIVLSSLAGASLIVDTLSLPGALEVGIFLGVLILGMVVQASLRRREKGGSPAPS